MFLENAFPAVNGLRRLWMMGLMAIFCSLLTLAPCRAAVLDWGSATWSPGALTKSYDVDGNGSFDIKVTVQNVGDTYNSGYPKVDSTTETGGYNGVNALQLWNTRESSTSSYTKVTIDFLAPSGVKNVSFQIWDVDSSSGQFVDVISQIHALTLSGSTINPTSVVGSADNTVSVKNGEYTVKGTNTAGDDTGNANVSIDFGTATVDQISFQWSNSDRNLGAQAIAIGPVSYSMTTPEVGASVAACGVCFAVIVLVGCHRRRSDFLQTAA